MNPMKLNRALFVLLLFALGGLPLHAQYGYSSGSLSMGKMRAASGRLPSPDEIVLEEYFNYHKHQIPLPQGEENVALDLQWGGADLTENPNEAVLQVGISTAFASSLEALPPVNVTLVIDKSGSMRGDRIAKAREAAHAFVDRLRPGDVLSIVAFDNEVEVVLPAQPLPNAKAAHGAIDRIHDEGGTNLDLGMLTGYEQLARFQKRGQTNRLIMLTDALTNTGITDPAEMVKHSQYYTADFEVDFTIVGIGTDFNQSLSRKLTSSARSSIFFINDAEDLKKVFIDEVESLLAPVGRDVMLEIVLPLDVEPLEVYGYQASIASNSIGIPLENINGGLTMVVPVRVKLPQRFSSRRPEIQARLRYFDVRSQQKRLLETSGKVRRSPESTPSVRKNFTIAQMAKGLQEMARLHEANQNSAAEAELNTAISTAESRFPDQSDADIQRVYDILKRYHKDLLAMAREDRNQD